MKKPEPSAVFGELRNIKENGVTIIFKTYIHSNKAKPSLNGESNDRICKVSVSTIGGIGCNPLYLSCLHPKFNGFIGKH